MAHKIDGATPGMATAAASAGAHGRPAQTGRVLPLPGRTTGPTMDLERVNALRAAIREGNYRPDPHRIALRMLQAQRELWGG